MLTGQSVDFHHHCFASLSNLPIRKNLVYYFLHSLCKFCRLHPTRTFSLLLLQELHSERCLWSPVLRVSVELLSKVNKPNCNTTTRPFVKKASWISFANTKDNVTTLPRTESNEQQKQKSYLPPGCGTHQEEEKSTPTFTTMQLCHTDGPTNSSMPLEGKGPLPFLLPDTHLALALAPAALSVSAGSIQQNTPEAGGRVRSPKEKTRT